ncbi:acyl-CoA thioesterase [Dendrosporobacter sp. 1207_IL3150]|uniref:acyl-CoA thioesterase n=1 Tax=Dendrosporobacter sp. 1207_IL3150 TaxID=3084054 RepID=UPI002FDB64FB
MDVQTYVIHHLVKSADLNHHGTLYAGRGAEWVVEAGFVAASSLTTTESTVCLNIHGMLFTRPVKRGSLLRYESKVVYAGRTSLVSYVKVSLGHTNEFVVDGFLTFIHVDENGKASPHGLTIEAKTPEDIELQEKARAFFKK